MMVVPEEKVKGRNSSVRLPVQKYMQVWMEINRKCQVINNLVKTFLTEFIIKQW